MTEIDCEFHEPDETCVHCLGDEIARLNGLIFAAVTALEVDSEWSADLLLDAITEALTILRPSAALTAPLQQELSSKGENA